MHQPELVKPPQDSQPVEGPPVMTHEDVQAINRFLAEYRRHYGGRVWHRATFRCPWPCSRGQYEEYKKNAVEKWLAVMEKKGWVLKGAVHSDAKYRRPAYGYWGDFVAGALLDQVEIPVAGLFEKERVETLKVEVLVKA